MKNGIRRTSSELGSQSLREECFLLFRGRVWNTGTANRRGGLDTREKKAWPPRHMRYRKRGSPFDMPNVRCVSGHPGLA